MSQIVVGGLGPGTGKARSRNVAHNIEKSPYVPPNPTAPVRHLFNAAESFDDLYDSSDSFENVYAAIVETLVSEAIRLGTIGYLVRDSPLVTNTQLNRLDADKGCRRGDSECFFS